MTDREQARGLSRRRLIGRAAAASVGVAVPASLVAAASAEVGAHPPAAPAAKGALPSGQNPVAVNLTVNGTARSLTVDARVTLLDALRERLGLPGTKKGCDRGQCGACTVHIDGRRVLSCLTLAASADGHQVTTIEGLATGGTLHPVQQAFVDHDGFQCGSCTSGQIMSAVALLKEGHTGTDDDVREWMSGNICRCGAYSNIIDAVRQATGGTA